MDTKNYNTDFKKIQGHKRILNFNLILDYHRMVGFLIQFVKSSTTIFKRYPSFFLQNLCDHNP